MSNQTDDERIAFARHGTDYLFGRCVRRECPCLKLWALSLGEGPILEPACSVCAYAKYSKGSKRAEQHLDNCLNCHGRGLVANVTVASLMEATASDGLEWVISPPTATSRNWTVLVHKYDDDGDVLTEEGRAEKLRDAARAAALAYLEARDA